MFPVHQSPFICIEDIQRDRKKGDLYVEVKINKTTHEPVIISEDGKPTSRAIIPFSQSDPSSLINISIKQARKRSQQDRLLGHVDIKENIAKLLEDSLPHELKRGLTRIIRAVFRREQTVSAGSIHLRLNVTDAQARAGLWVDMAERRVEGIRARKDKSTSADSAIGPVIQAVDQIVEIVDTVAEIHPLFDLSWKAVSALYKLISYQFKTDAKLVDMVDKMKGAYRLSTEAQSLNDRIDMLKSTIKDLLDETAKCSRAIRAYASHSFTGRMARWPEGKKMEEFAGRFAELRKKLDSVINVNTAKGVDNIESQQMLQTLRMQLELAKMDTSNMSTRARCLEGTRKDYRDRIMSRLFPDTNTDQKIVWLTGAAGAGKSTIALTISDACDERGCPAAYLFFERGKDEYISAVRMIAYRLADHYPSVRPHVAEINSNIIGSQLKTQFEKLLLKPLEAMAKGTKDSVVIILDALDECGTSKQREDLVRLLTVDFKKLPSNVRILVTSRPENDIMRHLSSKGHIHHMELEHTTQGSRRDVDLYIREVMMSTVEQEPPEGWEWDGVCKVLSEAADGLFIWAFTAVKMVAESYNPRRELGRLLGDIKSVGGGIDNLYSTLLEQSGITWYESEAGDEFTKILGVVLFAKEALSGGDIEAFLGLEKNTADTVLGRLRSVLSYETGKPVRPHHASFADYLTSDRSSGKTWNIDETCQKAYIAERCFDVMSEKLCFNICEIESSFIRNDEVPDLQDRIQKTIPSHLDYACRFWSVHFCEIPNPKDLLERLKAFANHRLLYWFEVLSLTGCFMRVATGALNDANLKIASFDSHLSSFLWAAYRLASVFANPISQSVPHIYLSAISLWKGESRVADHFSKSHPIVQVHRHGRKAPTPCIKVMEGHGSYVNSVVFSPDGNRIASGSADHTILVWDADAGQVVSGPFKGHTGEVNSVAFSSDGKRVASGSCDSTIRLWDVDSGDVLGLLEGHTSCVSSVAFSPTGKRIASGSADKTIRVWDAESGKAAADPFEGHTDQVNSVEFSPDGKCIASCSDDTSVRVCDAESGKLVPGLFQRYNARIYSVALAPDGKCIALCSGTTIHVRDMYSGKLLGRPIKGHTHSVRSIMFSPNGKRIASGSVDSTICVWDTDSGELVAGPFKGHTSGVQSVAFSPDGKRIASGSNDCTIRIWDAESGKFALDESQERTGPANSVLFSPDGKCVAAGSDDHTIRIWDAESGKFASDESQERSSPVITVSFSPDEKCIATGSNNRTTRIWDAESRGFALDESQERSGPVNSVSFSPDGKCVAAGSDDRTIRVWDAESGELVSGFFKDHTDLVRSVAFSPDGKHILWGSGGKTVCVWDAGSGALVLGPFKGHTDMVLSVAFSPNGKRIASGSCDKTVCVWDAGSGELILGPFKGHTDWVRSVAFSPDGRRVASGSADKTIRVWDASSGKLVGNTITGHTGEVCSVSFSPDGRCISSGSDDRTTRVWDVTDGKLVSGPFVGHTGRIWSVTYSPDGQRIASGSRDQTVRVWNANSGELLSGPFEGHAGSVNSVSFSPDGKYIASGSDDKSICVWDVDSSQLVLGPLKGHSDGVRSVAFSSDGKCLASGSWDGTIHVWEVNSSELKPSAHDVKHTNVSLRDRSSRIDKEAIILNWTSSEDGWVLGPGGELLAWIPEDMRSTLYQTRSTVIMSQGFSTRLDLANSPLGEEWWKGIPFVR
ncbi:hypothetical protein ACEPAI_8342 [Sanghuangporus weigelae]